MAEAIYMRDQLEYWRYARRSIDNDVDIADSGRSDTIYEDIRLATAAALDLRLFDAMRVIRIFEATLMIGRDHTACWSASIINVAGQKNVGCSRNRVILFMLVAWHSAARSPSSDMHE